MEGLDDTGEDSSDSDLAHGGWESDVIVSADDGSTPVSVHTAEWVSPRIKFILTPFIGSNCWYQASVSPWTCDNNVGSARGIDSMTIHPWIDAVEQYVRNCLNDKVVI